MEREKDKQLTADQVVDLYKFLAHGGDNHKDWLLRAIIAWNEGELKPEYQS